MYSRILFNLEKEFLAFATTWVNLEDVKLSEIRWVEKDNCCMISHVVPVSFHYYNKIHEIIRLKRGKINFG